MSSQIAPESARILVTASGTATGQGALSALRSRWPSAWLIAGDAAPAALCAGAHLSDAFVQMPMLDNPDFLVALVDLLESHSVDVYLPILDREVLIAARARRDGTFGPDLRLIAPGPEAAEVCLDKLKTAQWLGAHGFPSPQTIAATHAVWTGSPLFAKERMGVGSRNTGLVRSDQDLTTFRCAEPQYIVQELCTGPEVTVDVYVAGHDAYTVCRERLETKVGVCTKARIFRSQELEDLAIAVARSLDLRGANCIQFMRSGATGEWTITDVNARPGGATAMSVAVGSDFFCATVANSCDQPVREYFHPVPDGAHVVRGYREFVSWP